MRIAKQRLRQDERGSHSKRCKPADVSERGDGRKSDGGGGSGGSGSATSDIENCVCVQSGFMEAGRATMSQICRGTTTLQGGEFWTTFG